VHYRNRPTSNLRARPHASKQLYSGPLSTYYASAPTTIADIGFAGEFSTDESNEVKQLERTGSTGNKSYFTWKEYTERSGYWYGRSNGSDVESSGGLYARQRCHWQAKPDSAGWCCKPSSLHGIGLIKHVQNYFTKAALLILHSRVSLPPAYAKDSGTRRVNKWVRLYFFLLSRNL